VGATSGGRRDRIALALCAAAAISCGHVLLARQSGEQSIQAQLNERFAERPLAAAFEKYPRLRPPLYPMALWLARRAGLPPETFQVLVLDATLVALALYGRRFFGAPLGCALVLGYAVAHWSHANVHQRTAETLFAPVLVLFSFALWRYFDSARGVFWMGASASALALLRYFGLPLAVPLAVAAVAARRGPRGRKVRDLALVLVLALAPIAGWMWVTHQQTGYWTGTDRARPRDLPESVRHWEDLTGVDDHLRLTAKTLWIDVLSPDVAAAVNVVTLPYRPRGVEWGLAAIALAAAAAFLLAGRRAGWSRGAPSPAGAMAIVAASYLALTIVLWTAANNDPIHTRFLYPVYPLLWVAAFHAYDAVRRWSPSWRARAPWIALYAGVCAVQLLRSGRAEALPVRYLW
jgi:hypothetical protein